MANTHNALTLLIVSQEKTIRDNCRQMLGRRSDDAYCILEAESINDSFEYLTHREIDCIVLDYYLPDGDGLSFLEHFEPSADKAPVIIMLDDSDEALALKTINLGAYDYLLKDSAGDCWQKLPGMLSDITHNVCAERRQQLLEKQQKALLLTMTDVVFGVDADDTVLFLNPAAQELLGPNVNSVGEPIASVMPFHTQTDAEDFKEIYKDFLSNASAKTESQTVCMDFNDTTVYYEVTFSPVEGSCDDTNVGTIIVLHDVSSSKLASEELHYKATHDALTRLPNRVLFNDRIDQAILSSRRKEKKLAVLFMDLDGFKEVNDTLGHKAGDQLLVAVAERMKALSRKSDTIARVGGDEFLLLLTDIGRPENAARVASLIIQALAKPFALEGRKSIIGVSIGIAIFPDDKKEASDLLKAADQAMYRAKELGKNTYQFYQKDIKPSTKVSVDLSSEMRQALRKQDFKLVFQPQYQVQTDTVCGFEVFVRWHHDEAGDVAPKTFIPIAEGNGFIKLIGQWAFVQACQHFAKWKEMAQPLTLSFNTSMKQIETPGFIDWMLAVIQGHGIDPSSIILEIGDDIVMQNKQVIKENLTALKTAGFTLALDNFGVKPLCLSQLHHLPIDIIKIDGSFIAGLTNQENTLSMVNAMVHLASNLGCELVAAGVETETQKNTLLDIGCPIQQGFFFAKPTQEANIPAFLLPKDEDASSTGSSES